MSIQQWLESLPRQPGRAAAFDTRLGGKDAGWPKRAALDLIGYAAPRIGRALVAKCWTLVDEPQGFVVSAGEGPLLVGELERASAWGATLKAQVATSSVAPAH